MRGLHERLHGAGEVLCRKMCCLKVGESPGLGSQLATATYVHGDVSGVFGGVHFPWPGDPPLHGSIPGTRHLGGRTEELGCWARGEISPLAWEEDVESLMRSNTLLQGGPPEVASFPLGVATARGK